jgi:hypothetical protein
LEDTRRTIGPDRVGQGICTKNYSTTRVTGHNSRRFQPEKE